jgi:p-hydroxybenzoate 3-monooxygenase
MFLAHLLHAQGISCVVVERRDRAYVEGRVRAGVLEPITVELLHRLGLAQGIEREGLAHGGVRLSIDGELLRIDLAGLVGAGVTVYGQQEVMRDLFEGAEQRGIPVVWQADRVVLHGVEGASPRVTWHGDGAEHGLDCEFVVGCDGFHGVARNSIPARALRSFERVYPFGWLGIVADVPPCSEEVLYAKHARGFALASMRSPTRSRYYVQVPLDERVEDWPDERFWDEFAARLGPQLSAGLVRGPSFEKSIAPLRSFVCEPMRWGRLFLAGDAAHIVPPTGAKGLNLAVSDVVVLAEALAGHYRDGSDEGLERYSERALARVWKAERFSWWLTLLTHRFPDADPFAEKMQLAELDYLRTSETAQRSFAENYIGLPLEQDLRSGSAERRNERQHARGSAHA